jgi:hypothetical protein
MVSIRRRGQEVFDDHVDKCIQERFEGRRQVVVLAWLRADNGTTRARSRALRLEWDALRPAAGFLFHEPE